MRVIFKSVIICHCLRVNHHRILDAVSAGARDADEVGSACGAGTCCGGCRGAIDELVHGATDAKPVPVTTAPAAPARGCRAA